MNQKERMLAGLPYKAWLDGLSEERLDLRLKIHKFNSCSPDKKDEMKAMIKDIVGKCGKDIFIEPPFHCDYGKNIEVGENFNLLQQSLVFFIIKTRSNNRPIAS